MSKNDYYWMLVTPDRFELPMVVADTCAELASMVGKTAHNVHNAVTTAEARGSKSRYRRVLREREEKAK